MGYVQMIKRYLSILIFILISYLPFWIAYGTGKILNLKFSYNPTTSDRCERLSHWHYFKPVPIRVIDEINAHLLIFITDAVHFFAMENQAVNLD